MSPEFTIAAIDAILAKDEPRHHELTMPFENWLFLQNLMDRDSRKPNAPWWMVRNRMQRDAANEMFSFSESRRS